MGMMKAETTGEEWAKILKTGLENIQMRGKAEQGDKTMVDVWIAVVEAVENGELTHELIDEAVEGSYTAAALLQSGVDQENIEEQLEEMHIVK